jgi:hypothetical protein
MTTTARPSTDALVERLFGAVLAALDLQAVHLGDRLGWYRWSSRPSRGSSPSPTPRPRGTGGTSCRRSTSVR